MSPAAPRADACLAIITARGGSKRVPGKNLRPFDGVPTLARAISIARRAGCFDEVLVSTDDPEIAALAEHHGAWVPFLRSAATSHDHAGTFEVVHEVLDRLEAQGRRWPLAVCLYPTAVLARASDIAAAVASIRAGEARSILPVTPYEAPVWRALTADADGAVRFAFPEYALTRSQDLPPAWHDAGQWYAFDVAELRRHGDFMGPGARACILPPECVQDIDTPEDWARALAKHARLRAEAPPTPRPRPWVLFRVDASPESGSGHVMRCLALAEAFAARDHEVCFVSAVCPPKLRAAIRHRGFEWHPLEGSGDEDASLDAVRDAAATLSWLDAQERPPAWLVVDHYGLDATWERAVRAAGAPILALDDLADRPHACDALLDQNAITDHHARYPSLVPGPARLLLGGRYALLRREFQEAARERARRMDAGEEGSTTVFLGGTDAENLTLSLARALVGLGPGLLLVVGHLNPHVDAIRSWAAAHDVEVEIASDAVAERLAGTRLLVAACGMMAVEAQALGVPSLLVPLSPIQGTVAASFAEQGGAVVLTPEAATDPDRVAAAWAEAMALPTTTAGVGRIALDGADAAVAAILEPDHD